MRYLFLLSFISIAFSLKAQEDTVYLDDIAISGQSFQRFTAGSSYEELSIAPDQSTLDEVLDDEASIYFKTYGNRQLATISFRGTSSSQTNVLWHGIPANYPTLGQLDFSQWPVWLMESIGIQAGSAGALYGSGSIGGTVLLDSDINPGKGGNQALVRMEAGSFGQLFTGVKANYKTGNWSGKTGLFRSYIENDFPYEMGGEEVRQKNASVLDYGLQQQLVFRAGDHKLSLDGLFTQNDREIQPSKYSPSLEDQLETQNVRLAVSHTWEAKKGSLTSTVAYLQNDQLYNQKDRTVSNQYSVFSSYWIEWNNWLAFRAGINANHFTAESENYVDQFADLQTAVFGSAELTFTDWWKMVINLRQSFYKKNSPFTPSVGNEIAVFANQRNRILFTQQVAWGFRFPTLNDLHWVPGGNPNLRPEESFSAEASAQWQHEKQTVKSEVELTAFKTWSANWITWLPGSSGIWSPVNFQEVEITGLETSWSGEYTFYHFRQAVQVFYSYTRSLHMSGTKIGKQLPYTPLHNAGFRSEAVYKGWKFDFDGQFTGRRYTTLDNTSFNSVGEYVLFGADLRKAFPIQKANLEVGFQVENLFDQEYENLLNRAMPGRNYQMHLSLKL